MLFLALYGLAHLWEKKTPHPAGHHPSWLYRFYTLWEIKPHIYPAYPYLMLMFYYGLSICRAVILKM